MLFRSIYLVSDYEPSQHVQALEGSVNHRIPRADGLSTLPEVRIVSDVDDRVPVPGVERIGTMVVEEVQQRRAESSR